MSQVRIERPLAQYPYKHYNKLDIVEITTDGAFARDRINPTQSPSFNAEKEHGAADPDSKQEELGSAKHGSELPGSENPERRHEQVTEVDSHISNFEFRSLVDDPDSKSRRP